MSIYGDVAVNVESVAAPPSAKFRLLQFIQGFMLFASYGSTYLAISSLSLAVPLMVATRALTLREISLIVIATKVARFIPKLFSGAIVDVVGGKLCYIISHFLIALSLILCAIRPYKDQFLWIMITYSAGAVFTVVSWPAVVKMSSMWYHYQSMGKIMAVISLSFLAGDSIARAYLALFVSMGVTWNMLFIIAGVSMAVFGVLGQLVLTNSPTEWGYEEPEGDPRNLLGESGLDSKIEDESFWKTFGPIFTSPSFWLLALIYIGLTFVRYIIIDWVPQFLVSRANATPGMASLGSMLPPLLGSISALMMGFLTDIMSTNWRNISLLFFEVLMVGVTLIQWLEIQFTVTSNAYLAIVMFGILGFALNGPYSLPSAALSVEYGGKKINATISGLFDGFGMLGAVMSGVLGLILLDQENPKAGWEKIFLITFITSCVVVAFTIFFIVVDFISKRRKQQK